MNGAPSLPTRPDKGQIESRARDYASANPGPRSLGKQARLLDAVPPLPNTIRPSQPRPQQSPLQPLQHPHQHPRPPMPLPLTHPVTPTPSTTLQSNLLYSSGHQSPHHSPGSVGGNSGGNSVLQRPSTLSTLSTNNQSLIDFNSVNNNNNHSAEELESQQKVENIRRLLNNVHTYSNVSTPVDGMASLGFPKSNGQMISFMQNPLYANVPSSPIITTMTSNNITNHANHLPVRPPLQPSANYANIIAHTYSNVGQNHSANNTNGSSLISPIHQPFDAFLYQQQRMQNELMNSSLLEKIQSVTQEQQAMRQQQHLEHLSADILSPTAIPAHEQANHLTLPPQEILNMFDPLSQELAKRATHSPIPMATPTSDPPTHSPHSLSSPHSSGASGETFHSPSNEVTPSGDFTTLMVEQRKEIVSKDLQEFVEHLRALYLSIKSRNTSLSSLGLIWSPRIEIDNVECGHVGSSDQYMISPGKRLRESRLQQEQETDFLLEVRYNSLIHCKLNNEPLPRPAGGSFRSDLEADGEEHRWYSIKIPATMKSVVEAIILYIIHNVGKEDANINPDDFLIKVHDLNEYLIPKSDLFSYVYVQKCKRLNQDVVLEMVDKTVPEFWRPFLEHEADSLLLNDDKAVKQALSNDAGIKFTNTSELKLNEKIDELNMLFAQFLSLADIVNLVASEKALLNEIFSAVKSIQTELSGIQLPALSGACHEMNELYNRHIAPGNAHLESAQIDNEVLRDNFRILFAIIIESLKEMIGLYSRAFPVDFELKVLPTSGGIELPKKREESIARNITNLKINVDSVFQMPEKERSKYNFFVLRATVSYGFKVLDYKLTSKQANINQDYIMFDQELKFDSVILSELPREARLNFELIGAPSSSPNGSEFRIIATTFFYIFNQARQLEQGYHLLTFDLHEKPASFSANSEQIAMVRPRITDDNHVISLPLEPSAMMMVFSLPKTSVRYYFPEVDSIKNPSTKTIGRSHSNRVSLNSVVPLPARVASQHSVTDSLYGFYGYSAANISENNRQKIIDIVQRNPLEALTVDECKLIWENRQELSQIPGAILKILKSPSNFSSTNLRGIYSMLEDYDLFSPSPLSLGSNRHGKHPAIPASKRKLPFVNPIEALQLLGSDFPDQIIRRKAVWWLKTVSVDELCDYLPQLIQALRYEPHIDCHLIWLLFECSLISARFCHFFYWLLISNHQNPIFGPRARFYTVTLKQLCTGHCSQMTAQEKLCSELAKISETIKKEKAAKNPQVMAVLFEQLVDINGLLKRNPIGIPLSPSVQVDGLLIEKCSFFNSNSLPLKIVFTSSPPYNAPLGEGENLLLRPNLIRSIYQNRRHQPMSKTVIFKCGDDLRQDMLVMQFISIINRIWLRSGLDLRLVSFGVMNSHERTGMIEMVTQAQTLREIGVTGSHKNRVIADWLKRHNTNTYQYLMAVENFLHSCAGYVVITYLLGICDRHNDNIMITTSGHLFHIDFGKFLGDAQRFSGIKRDRAPFVFTTDMLYVINDGDKMSKNYQFFVELCCNCFSIVRRHGNFLLSLLSTMIPSGIFGLTPETIMHFHKALMPDLTESHAKAKFTTLIEESKKSLATKIMFISHTFAHSLSSSSTPTSDQNGHPDPANDFSEGSPDPWKFSFSVERSTAQKDGKIIAIDVIGVKKNGKKSDKVYYNKVRITRERNIVTYVYRSYKEFVELSDRLTTTFTLANMNKLAKSPILSRSNRFEVAKQRCHEVYMFIEELKRFSSEILHSDIVYTFFHQIHRDTEILEPELTSPTNAQQTRKVKLTISYDEKKQCLSVLVGHGRNFEIANNPTPNTYVKLYLMPDPQKLTKRKTKVKCNQANPVYMEPIVYNGIHIDDLRSKTLEVSVWADELPANHRLGSTHVYMNELNLAEVTEKWYNLSDNRL